MRKAISFSSIVLATFLLWSAAGLAQAPAPTNVSNNIGWSLTPAVAVDSLGSVHFVWSDTIFASGRKDIFHRSWNGSTWIPPLTSPAENLSSNFGESEAPALAVDSAGNVHLAWHDLTPGDWQIFYRRWNGSAWMPPLDSPAENLSNNLYTYSTFPSIAADSLGNVHLVWNAAFGSPAPREDIFYRRWSPGGGWSPIENLSQSSVQARMPKVATFKGNVHVVWQDLVRDNLGDNFEVFYRRWNGSTWSPTENLSNSAVGSSRPAIAVDPNGSVHVLWDDELNYDYFQIFYRRWNGSAWSTTENISSISDTAKHPAVAAGPSGGVHVLWENRLFDRFDYDITYRRWDGSGWSTAENLYNNAALTSSDPAVAADSTGRAHFAWMEETETPGNPEILYTALASAPGPSATPTSTPPITATPALTPAATATSTATPVPTALATVVATSTPAGPAGPGEIRLAAGWNLISVPGAQQDPSVGAVFAQNPAVTSVYAFQDNTWAIANRGAGGWSGTLTQIVDGKGYWVSATSATTLALNPKAPDPLAPPPSYPLPGGWSLIGYTSSKATTAVSTYLASLEGKWEALYRYGETSGWESAKPGGLGFTEMQTGRGYWIHVTAPGTLLP